MPTATRGTSQTDHFALSSIAPRKLAQKFLNSLTDTPGVKGAPRINRSQITVIDYGYSTKTRAPDPYEEYAVGNAEISFTIPGSTYQSLINAMLSKANASNLDPTVSIVDASHPYRIELGLSVGAQIDRWSLTYSDGWQGAAQIFDAVTGAGSMGYGWRGTQAPGRPLSVYDPIISAAKSTDSYIADFVQPSANGTISNVPQQQVARLYVQNYLGQSPTTLWPPNRFGSTDSFNPIPTNPAFTPTDFGI